MKAEVHFLHVVHVHISDNSLQWTTKLQLYMKMQAQVHYCCIQSKTNKREANVFSPFTRVHFFVHCTTLDNTITFYYIIRIRIRIRIHLLARRNLLCTWQYSNKRIIYENQQYHILLNTYTLGYYNLQHRVRYHSYLTLYNLIATGRNVVRSRSVVPFTTRRLPWGSTVIYLCMEWSSSFTILVMRDLHFVMYTLLGSSVNSCTDTSVILHTLS